MHDNQKMLDVVVAAVGSGDVPEAMAGYTDDAVFEEIALGKVFTGKAEIHQLFADFVAAVPDLRFDIHLFFANGNQAASTWTMSGTAIAGLPEAPLPGAGSRRFSVPGASIYEFSDDHLIRRETAYWNLADLHRQFAATDESEEAVR